VDLIKIYVDEDAVDRALVVALRSREVIVTTALESGLIEKPDDEHLTHATQHGLVPYTFNVSDFYQLHTQWLIVGREHAGMILARQQRYSVGEQMRRLLRIRASASAQIMRNRVEFLGNWG
jgi:mRNA degradation ribonuclease J1/J2